MNPSGLKRRSPPVAGNGMLMLSAALMITCSGGEAVLWGSPSREPGAGSTETRASVRMAARQDRVVGDDIAGGDGFGFSVAASGQVVVVGAPFHDEKGPESGAAYVFVRTAAGWLQQAKLTASDASQYGLFGVSVAISGDTIVVGAPHDGFYNADPGSAYVFARDGAEWVEQARLSGDAAFAWGFGWASAVNADSIVVGARYDRERGASAGAAYVFSRDGWTWTPQQKLLASDETEEDEFGQSVAMTADEIVVGAPRFSSGNGGERGTAYVFARTGATWNEQAMLRPNDQTSTSLFAVSVAMSDDIIVAGARGGDENATGSGAAYVFQRSGASWIQQAKLVTGKEWDWAGLGVGISANYIIMTAYLDAELGWKSAGSVHVFEQSGTDWSSKGKLHANDVLPCNTFAFSAAISGDTVIVGAPAPENDVHAGSAYAFLLRCAEHAQCPPGHYCLATTCESQRDQGSTCTSPEQCSSGFCVDGYCCDSSCDGACWSCAGVNTKGGVDGSCDVVKPGTDPQDRCSAGQEPCGPIGLCGEDGACQGLAPRGTPCGVECIEQSAVQNYCDGFGICESGASIDCGPFACNPGVGACRTVCHEDADCSPKAHCNVALRKCSLGEPDDSTVAAEPNEELSDTRTIEGGGCGCSIPRSASGSWVPAFLLLCGASLIRRRC